MVERLRILPTQGTGAGPLVWEGSPRSRAARTERRNHWAHVLQLLKTAHPEPARSQRGPRTTREGGPLTARKTQHNQRQRSFLKEYSSHAIVNSSHAIHLEQTVQWLPADSQTLAATGVNARTFSSP